MTSETTTGRKLQHETRHALVGRASRRQSAPKPPRRRGPLLVWIAFGLSVAGSLSAFSCTNAVDSKAADGVGSIASVEVADMEASGSEDEAEDTTVLEEEAEPEVEARPIAYELEVDDDAAKSFEGTQAYADFAAAVGAIEDSGHEVSVVVSCPDTGSGFSYHADCQYYSASSIKGPFVAALYQTQVDGGTLSLDAIDGTAEQTIVNSDNDCYDRLRDSYSSCFAPWLEANGVDLGSYASYSQLGAWYYLTLYPTQLAQMWIGVYNYLSQAQTPAADQLKGYFEQRATSPLRDALGNTYTTWGKAGWFYEYSDYHSAPCANEAGVVLADKPYIVAVMSSEPGDLDALVPVFTAVDELHELYEG